LLTDVENAQKSTLSKCKNTQEALKTMETEIIHPWYALSRFKKRLHGFLTYQMSSFVSLYNPELMDKVMYKVLKDQFEGDK